MHSTWFPRLQKFHKDTTLQLEHQILAITTSQCCFAVENPEKGRLQIWCYKKIIYHWSGAPIYQMVKGNSNLWVHIQPKLYAMPQWARLDFWTHTIFHWKPTLKIDKICYQIIKRYKITSKGCSSPLQHISEKHHIPSGRGSPGFQATGMLFAEQKRTGTFCLSHPKPDI